MSRVGTFLLASDPRYRERTSPRAIVRVAILASILFAILASLYAYVPVWAKGYGSYFRGFGDAAFSQFWIWPRASIEFFDLNSPTLVADLRKRGLPENFPIREANGVKDTLVLCENSNESHRQLGQLRTSSKIVGYWPTAMVLALAVSTPWPWKRIRWVILWCLLSVHALIVARLTIFALKGSFAVPAKSIRIFTPSEFWSGLLLRLDEVVNDDPTFNFIAAFVLWIGVLVLLELWRGWREAQRKPIRTEVRPRIERPLRR